jgi:hypothetical protein
MNTTPIPIPRQLAADMAAAARIEVQRQHENQRAFVTFVVAVAGVLGIAYYLLG